MILQDEQGNKYEFEHDCKECRAYDNIQKGTLKPIKEQEYYVEGSLFCCDVGQEKEYLTVERENHPDLLKYAGKIKNIPDETLIKTIVQCWFKRCTYTTTNRGLNDYDFRADSGEILAFIRFSDKNLKMNLPEIEIKRI